MSSFLAVAATVMGVGMAISPLLQLKLILKERDAKEVSQGFLAVIGAGNLVWLSYAIDTENLVLIIPNSVGFICSLSTLLVARRFS